MHSKDDFLAFFKSSSGSTRIDLLCRVLRFCSPLELRFIASVLEDMCRKDHHDLQNIEHRINAATLTADGSSVSLHEKSTRRRLLITLALLRSDNQPVARRLFEQLMQSLCVNGGLKDSVELYDEGLLLLLMAANHPALLFDERQRLWRRIEQLTSGSEVSFAEKSLVDKTEPAEKLALKKIEVKDVQQRAGTKTYEYCMEVSWSDGSVNFVHKTHQELFEFQNKLLDKFPNEGGKKNRTIPFLPGKRYLARYRELADKRLPDIADYARKLVLLPAKISQCQFVLDFFSEGRQQHRRQPNALADALADASVSGLELDGHEKKAGVADGKLSSCCLAATNHSSPSSTSLSVTQVSLCSQLAPTVSTETSAAPTTSRSVFVPPLVPYHAVRHTKPGQLMFLQQPAFSIQQPHMQFRQAFPQQFQPSFRQNLPTSKFGPLNASSYQPSIGIARPMTPTTRAQFTHAHQRRDKHHHGDGGSLHRVHSLTRNSRNEVKHAGLLNSSSSLPSSPLMSPVFPPHLGGFRSSPSPNSSVTGTPSPIGRHRHSSSTSSSPGVLQDRCTITSLYEWLKSLRLHKYHHLFEKMTYEEMLALTEEDLEKLQLMDGPRRKFMKQLECLKSQGFKGFDSDHLPFTFRTTTSQSSLDSDTCTQLGGSNMMETDFNDSKSVSPCTYSPGPSNQDHQSHEPVELLNEELTCVPGNSSSTANQMEEAATFVIQFHPQPKGNLVSFAAPVMIDSMPVGDGDLSVTHSSVHTGVSYGPDGLITNGGMLSGGEFTSTFQVSSQQLQSVSGEYSMPHQLSCYRCGQHGHSGPNCQNSKGMTTNMKEFSLRLNATDKVEVPAADSADH